MGRKLNIKNVEQRTSDTNGQRILVQFKDLSVPAVKRKKRACNDEIQKCIDPSSNGKKYYREVKTLKAKNNFVNQDKTSSASEVELDQSSSQSQVDSNFLPRTRKKMQNLAKKKHVKSGLNSKLISSFANPFNCNHCNKSFSKRISLTKHLQQHEEKIFVCQHCSKSFAKQWMLNQHKRFHINERPYTCKHCNKSFTTTSDLNRHIKIHLDVKPYTCEFCNRQFSQRTNLFAHLPVHTGIRPYTCPQCNRGYLRKNHLDDHVLTHSGIKPYSCEHCDIGFAQKVSLIRHNSKFHRI